MPRQAPPRIHRLPQWTDQILVPAPSDLSLTEVANKSPLPTIIVTPCTPSSPHDFSLAFIPSPPKQTLRDRLKSYKAPYAPSLRVRAVLCAFLFLFFVCQLLASRLAARYVPRLDFTVGEVDKAAGDHRAASLEWFQFWPKAGEGHGGGVPEYVPFDREVGSWLD